MHILKIIHGYPLRYNAGSEVYSQSICNELSKTHRVSVFTREEDPFRHDFDLRSERQTALRDVHYINMPREKDGYRHAALDAAFGDLLDRLRPDIAHIGHLNHLSTGLVDQLYRRSIPIVFTLHDYWLMCPRGQFLQRNFADPGELYRCCDGQEDRKCADTCYSMYYSGKAEDLSRDQKYWTSWIASRMDEARRISKKIDLFLAPSRYLQQRFIEDFGLPAEKVRYLDYGFPTAYLTGYGPRLTNEYTFGYIGTHIPAKGIDYLIKAFGQLKGKARLRIWGRERSQETAALKALATASVTSGNAVEWMGEYINQNIADAVFRHCDAIVVPSIWAENSPLVIHEAQACKVPVITAKFGGMREYVRHNVNGLLFGHRDPDDLTRKMQWAMEHPQEMEKLGAKGYLYSDNGAIPGISEHCKALLAIYRSIIDDHAEQFLETHA